MNSRRDKTQISTFRSTLKTAALGAVAILGLLTGSGCSILGSNTGEGESKDAAPQFKKYASVRLGADLSGLSPNQRKMLPFLFAAAKEMDELFWEQAYGDRSSFMKKLRNPTERAYAKINYGPWDRLDDNRSFLSDYGPKPKGANFYPSDMTEKEFEQAIADSPNLEGSFRNLYTVIRRDDRDELVAVPYHVEYKEGLQRASRNLLKAAELAEDAGFKHYLTLRAKALLDDEYQPSDLAWMDMTDNRIDVVIGPIETYEDQLFEKRAAFEAYILIKDLEWSERLSRYASLLPALQRGLPVPDAYKAEEPGRNSQLNAYDVIYYAGDCNAGSKTIAINLPNDEEVQLQKGSRRLQLKNAMRAKFDKIMVPLNGLLIAEDQRRHVTFDAFFGNTMFHEVAHGLGIKHTISGNGTVSDSLKDLSSAFEEGKADVLGLYMVESLFESGQLTEGSLEDHFVTFLAGIFRSVRFGAASAHGRANMIRFNFFQEAGAFSRDEVTGTYRVNFEAMSKAVKDLSRKILMVQGDGDYDEAKRFADRLGKVGPGLAADLKRAQEAGIPDDIVFEQGLNVVLP